MCLILISTNKPSARTAYSPYRYDRDSIPFHWLHYVGCAKSQSTVETADGEGLSSADAASFFLDFASLFFLKKLM